MDATLWTVSPWPSVRPVSRNGRHTLDTFPRTHLEGRESEWMPHSGLFSQDPFGEPGVGMDAALWTSSLGPIWGAGSWNGQHMLLYILYSYRITYSKIKTKENDKYGIKRIFLRKFTKWEWECRTCNMLRRQYKILFKYFSNQFKNWLS